MFRKTLAVILALCAAFCWVVPAFAADDIGTISVKLNSDIDGYTSDDTDKLIEVKSDNVVLGGRADPVYAADYGGTDYDGAFKAGRTYSVYYCLVTANGSLLPPTADELDIEYELGKGVKVITAQVVTKPGPAGDLTNTDRGIRIFARVTVDGNAIQRFFGLIADIILKIQAWSLY